MLRSLNCSSLDLLKAPWFKLLALSLMLARRVWGWICLSSKKHNHSLAVAELSAEMLGHQCYGVKKKKHYQHLNTNLSQALLLFWGLVIQTVNQFISSGPKRSYSARDICYLCHGLEVFLDNLQGSAVDDWGEDIAQTHTPWAAFLIPWILFFPYKSLYVRKDLKTIY